MWPMFMPVTLAEIIAGSATAITLGWVADDALVAWSLVVLFVGLKLTETDDNLFVLPAAFSFHWMQTSLGVLYKGLFAREVATVYSSNYRPMVWIGLGCCLALAVGLRLGLMFVKGANPHEERPTFAFSLQLLATVYVVTVFFEGSLLLVCGQYSALRQIVATAHSARLGVLKVFLRRVK